MSQLYLQACLECDAGTYTTYMTRTHEDINKRKRYFKCNCCGHKPANNTVVIPLSLAPRRKSHRMKMKKIF